MTLAAVFALTITLICAVIITDDRRRTRTLTVTAPTLPTRAADALANAISEHLDAGGNLNDILGGEIEAHASGGYHVTLVTARDVARVGDEAAAWLERGAL
jgi:hypothetical protein